MTKKMTTATIDPQRAKLLRREIHESHLFGELSRLISIGAYQRLPEFRGFTYLLTDQQRISLESALKRQLSDKAVESLQKMIPRMIEHELIMVRTPSITAISKEIAAFEKRARECLSILRKLQLAFNDENQKIARPTLSIESDAGAFPGPPDAYTAAVNVIRRNMSQPIPAFLELGPLVEVCRALREKYRAKRGPKSNSFLPLYYYVLGRCALGSGLKPTLPPKNSFVRTVTNRPTPFLTFTRAALNVLQDIAPIVLVMDTITRDERETVFDALHGYTVLTDEALSEQLAAAVNLKLPGMVEFFEAASS